MNGAVNHLQRAAKVAAIVFLSAAHAGFLWRRVADQSLSEPRVLARWVAAVLVLAAFLLVRRNFSRRVSPVAITLWLLVAVLHAAVPTGDRILDARDDVALLLQTGLAALPAALLLATLIVATIERDRHAAFLPIVPPAFAWSLSPDSPDASRAPPRR